MNMPHRISRTWLPLLAMALLVGAAAAVAQGSSEPASGYAGSEMCATCHENAMPADSPHARPGFARLSPLGCEACHGPAAAHANDPENDALRPRISTRSAREQSAICAQCHDGGEQAFWRGSAHETRGLSCLSCHSLHQAQSERFELKAANTLEQCYQCHKDVRADTWKNSHHPIREGKVSCADCHNPHGTTAEKMVVAASINDLCYSCHTQYRGPFVWEHPPVRENCLNCHTPHGSNHSYLQKTSIPFVCQQCHMHTRHPGTLYDGFRLPTQIDESTGNARIVGQACLNCHPMIHGTNNPSSPYFGN